MRSKKTTKIRVTRTGRRLIIILLLSLGIGVISSCNVTRTVTTQSECFRKGDTLTTIVTRTVETYDAVKKQ